MKTRDNVIPIDQSTKAESSNQPVSPLKRVLMRTKRVLSYIVVVVIVFILGAVILLQGDNLVAVTAWLERAENGLLFWRLALYGGALMFGPKWLLTPEQQSDDRVMTKTRVLIVGIALAFEILLVQKGLAGLAQLIHGGF